MENIYNYFKTYKLLCKDTDNLKKNNIKRPSSRKSSILNKYRTEIYKLKENLDKNYNANTDNVIINIDKLFEDFLISKDIDKFVDQLFLRKMGLSSKSNTKISIKNLLSTNKINSNHETILNPLFESAFINSSIINSRSISRSTNFINDVDQNNLNLDILSQGKFINLSYPTLGVINQNISHGHPYFSTSTNKYSSILELFNEIQYNVYLDFEKYFTLPIQKLNFGNTVINILSNGSLNSISSINEYINTVDISMLDQMTVIQTTKNKKKRYLIEKYIIPYEFKNDVIVKISTNKVIKYWKNYQKYIEDEKMLLDNVYNNLITKRRNLSKNVLNDLYKIMYLISHRNINLFYDIYWNFINKQVNKYVMDLRLSNDKRYKSLDYKGFSSYLEKMNMSLLNMKKILLNNLYQVYKPSLLGKNYGVIYLKEYGNIAFIDDNTIFTGKDIFHDEFNHNLYFDKNYKGTLKNLKHIVEFLPTDIYSDEKLFIGVSYDNNEHVSSTLGILNLNSSKIKTHKKLNLKIVNYIIKIFNNCIPIELLNDITSKKTYLNSNRLIESDKNKLKNYILNEFKKYISKSSSYLIKIKKSGNNDLRKLKLKSKISYNIAYFIYRTVLVSLNDVSLKNEIITEINQIKIKYLQIIKEKLK